MPYLIIIVDPEVQEVLEYTDKELNEAKSDFKKLSENPPRKNIERIIFASVLNAYSYEEGKMIMIAPDWNPPDFPIPKKKRKRNHRVKHYVR